jgi:hypothetical protein
VKIQVVINAWAGGQAIFDRLMPFWKAHGLPIIVVCPSNSKVKTTLPIFEAGPAGQAGPNTFTRWKNELKFLRTLDYDGYVIFEYDSVCLDRGLIVKPGLRGIGADSQEAYMASYYVIPPWTLDRESLNKLCHAAIDHPEIYENGHDDRLLCAWALAAGVPILDHDRPFHAPGGGATIVPEQYEALRIAVENGAVWIHGLKSQDALDVAVKARARWMDKTL